MKRFIILLCIAVLLLASCAEEVPADVSVSLAGSFESSSEDASSPDAAFEWPHHRNPYADNSDPVMIAEGFPDFTDQTIETETVKQHYGEYFLVVKIESDRTYAAMPFAVDARVVLWGDYSGLCKVGDYIRLEIGEYRRYDSEENGTFYSIEKEQAEFSGIEEDMDNVYVPAIAEKPVIYLYPEEEMQVSVKLEYDGKLTCTYPAYDGGVGWENLTVLPDGTIYDADGKEYYCLYWEGMTSADYDFSKGFCVRGEDTAEFLETVLPKIGLNAREANEFIIYWLPQMQENTYNIISFQTEVYTDTARLTVNPNPDSLLRVFMAYYASETPVEMEEQVFEGFKRSGFTVVEWGGSLAQVGT